MSPHDQPQKHPPSFPLSYADFEALPEQFKTKLVLAAIHSAGRAVADVHYTDVACQQPSLTIPPLSPQLSDHMVTLLERHSIIMEDLRLQHESLLRSAAYAEYYEANAPMWHFHTLRKIVRPEAEREKERREPWMTRPRASAGVQPARASAPAQPRAQLRSTVRVEPSSDSEEERQQPIRVRRQHATPRRMMAPHPYLVWGLTIRHGRRHYSARRLMFQKAALAQALSQPQWVSWRLEQLRMRIYNTSHSTGAAAGWGRARGRAWGQRRWWQRGRLQRWLSLRQQALLLGWLRRGRALGLNGLKVLSLLLFLLLFLRQRLMVAEGWGAVGARPIDVPVRIRIHSALVALCGGNLPRRIRPRLRLRRLSRILCLLHLSLSPRRNLSLLHLRLAYYGGNNESRRGEEWRLNRRRRLSHSLMRW